MTKKPLLFTLFPLCWSLGAIAAPDIAELKIEPSNWWAGMHNPKLELMLHGKGIGQAELRLENAHGVELEKTFSGSSANYLFADLDLGQASSGDITLVLTLNGREQRLSYSLLERQAGSAERASFDGSDLIYLITPDRFANGDSSNDNVAALGDAADPDNKDGRHGGDLKGITQHLDYLADLGVTQLWINPVMENRQQAYSYHGYSITDFYNVDQRFGTNQQYRELVQAADQKGMGVIKDVVLNHIGSGHWWMQDLPFPDWINYANKPVYTSHRRTTQQDPYATDADQQDFASGWFVDSMPDLNQRNPQLATYLIQNSIWWIEFAGLSGLRTDTWSYSDKAFLTRWAAQVRGEYPGLNIVGEEWSTNPNIVSYWQKGKINPDGYVSELPALMDFPLNDTLLRAINTKEDWGKGWIELYEALVNDNLYPVPHNLVLFEGNHDTNRLYSVLGEDLDKYKLALAYVFCVKRIPQLFYGTEVLLTSPVEGRHDGLVRGDMPGFNADDRVDAFTGKGLSTEQKQAQAFVRTLAQFRKQSRALAEGQLKHFVPQKGVYVLYREAPANEGKAAEHVLLLLNKNPGTTAIDMGRFAQYLPPGTRVNSLFEGKSFNLPAQLQLSAPVTLLSW
ncbi:cyclomaltodextrinase N-terminal domain-containing protein [Shewanella cyperi]|uniref:Cyclomaltodextrinase N-terminal domain-containing protein n=1 Tax=Shewanella cyperi TaxID=2814292 RepID=A0A975AJA4_9GAMM|nr:glycoside hydrolase family 13 protein [Shewanella cyperi]QSX28516.1 cyclomaltodextrinase N-terminal domain-containing protein [Shewanella cyperi]